MRDVNDLQYAFFNDPNVKNKPEQIKIVESGGYTYFCFSTPGTAESTNEWMIFRIDSSGNKQYADANAHYDNIATDPTLLSYSYS